MQSAQAVVTTKKVSLASQLMWTEAVRALICMIPLIIAVFLGKTSSLAVLGQGGFFYSSLFLPKRISGRFVMGSLVLALGLGFYMIGGTVSANPWTALIFTFLVCLNLSFLTSWKVGGPLALTFIMIYTAGLNTGSPARAASNFFLFALVLGWSALISLLPFWKPVPVPPPNTDEVGVLAEQGLKMGIGAAIALAISYAFGFVKLGWAPSAVGNIVRYDPKMSKARAWARFLGTIGGAVLAAIALAFVSTIYEVVLVGAIGAVLNGLFKKTKLGAMPLFYTATILLLYSANDISDGSTVILERIFYNLVGITIGMLVVLYPFPIISKLFKNNKAVS